MRDERPLTMTVGDCAACALKWGDKVEVAEREAESQRERASQAVYEADELKARFTAPIVCLCGSTRFMGAFFEAGWNETLAGKIVLSVGVCKHAKNHGAEALGPEVVEALDELHKRKIDLADEVLVLDVDGYIGDSTRSEIEYATAKGKPIRYLSVEFPGYEESVDQAEAACAEMREALEKEVEITTHSMHLARGVLTANIIGAAKAALSSSCGKAMLERTVAAEKANTELETALGVAIEWASKCKGFRCPPIGDCPHQSEEKTIRGCRACWRGWLSQQSKEVPQ